MNKEYLKGGLFDKDFMQTKVKTNRISAAERVLGYIVGPGFVYLQYSTVNSLRELYFMDVIRINEVYGSKMTYMYLTIVTTVIGMLFGFLLNHITEKTASKAGRFRPYVLIGNILLAVSGLLIFWSPFAFGTKAHLVWLYIACILYTSISVPMWNLKSNVVSVCSRNVLERNSLTTLSSAVTVMIGGTFGALIITGMLYPTILQHDLTGRSWILTIAVCAILCVIAAFFQYFYTRERVTEENQLVLADESDSATVTVPLKTQLKNALTDKYFLLAMVALCFRTGSRSDAVIGMIDGTLYISKVGTPYMVFCHEWKQIHDGTVCAVELSPDLKKSVGEPRELFKASSAKPFVKPFFFTNSSRTDRS